MWLKSKAWTVCVAERHGSLSKSRHVLLCFFRFLCFCGSLKTKRSSCITSSVAQWVLKIHPIFIYLFCCDGHHQKRWLISLSVCRISPPFCEWRFAIHVTYCLRTQIELGAGDTHGPLFGMKIFRNLTQRL